VWLVTQSGNLRLTAHLAFLSPQSWKIVHVAPESRDVHREMLAALDQLVRDAQEEGSIRGDVGPGDLLNLVSLVLGTRPPASDPTGQLWAERSLRLVLDGLRANRGSILPGVPVTMQDLHLRIEQRGGDT